MAVSPFAPDSLNDLPPIGGVRLAACEAGIRYAGRMDLMMALFDPGTHVGGVLTRSRTAAAPVEWCRERLPLGTARALVVNSGNANAFTGMRGRDAVEATAKAAAAVADCSPDDVFLASTGVIGEALDPEGFTGKLAGLAGDANAGAYEDAARAIMTTDTFPKLATATATIGGETVTVNGIAKGSGMIAPDMATMLAFLFTDAPLAAPVVQSICARSADKSFNAITVDGDTSTSDTVLLFATGAAAQRGVATVESLEDDRVAPLAEACDTVMTDLAHQIVKDGEGASKFVEVIVEGAEDARAARAIAFAIANSPLVKTALAGEDPNWGRVVMAVGKAGELADRDRLSIWFGDIKVATDGEADPAYREELGAQYMKRSELTIRVDVGVGSAASRVWTCDLTAQCVSINADYRS